MGTHVQLDGVRKMPQNAANIIPEVVSQENRRTHSSGNSTKHVTARYKGP